VDKKVTSHESVPMVVVVAAEEEEEVEAEVDHEEVAEAATTAVKTGIWLVNALIVTEVDVGVAEVAVVVAAVPSATIVMDLGICHETVLKEVEVEDVPVEEEVVVVVEVASTAEILAI